MGGGVVTLFGPPEFKAAMSDIWQGAADRVAVSRANAAAEDQKTSAPCGSCGRLMPAAERCADCRANGVWFCAACHAKFEGFELADCCH